MRWGYHARVFSGADEVGAMVVNGMGRKSHGRGVGRVHGARAIDARASISSWRWRLRGGGPPRPGAKTDCENASRLLPPQSRLDGQREGVDACWDGRTLAGHWQDTGRTPVRADGLSLRLTAGAQSCSVALNIAGAGQGARRLEPQACQVHAVGVLARQTE
jgi:hypothetical protein